ncbi:MAG: hypothetical protein J7L37_04605 [Thermococcus sp.]|nr:hypothetical protein [Thermococcus sp.]
MRMDDEMAMKVLKRVDEMLAALEANPTPENLNTVIDELRKNSEVVMDAVFAALKPEFRGLGEQISKLLVGGVLEKV